MGSGSAPYPHHRVIPHPLRRISFGNIQPRPGSNQDFSPGYQSRLRPITQKVNGRVISRALEFSFNSQYLMEVKPTSAKHIADPFCITGLRPGHSCDMSPNTSMEHRAHFRVIILAVASHPENDYPCPYLPSVPPPPLHHRVYHPVPRPAALPTLLLWNAPPAPGHHSWPVLSPTTVIVSSWQTSRAVGGPVGRSLYAGGTELGPGGGGFEARAAALSSWTPAAGGGVTVAPDISAGCHEALEGHRCHVSGVSHTGVTCQRCHIQVSWVRDSPRGSNSTG